MRMYFDLVPFFHFLAFLELAVTHTLSFRLGSRLCSPCIHFFPSRTSPEQTYRRLASCNILWILQCCPCFSRTLTSSWLTLFSAVRTASTCELMTFAILSIFLRRSSFPPLFGLGSCRQGKTWPIAVSDMIKGW